MYTIDNPKEVANYYDPEERSFTGVVKDKGDIFVYYCNGKYHREDGPAIIHRLYSEYRMEGLRHREDGPAVIYADGTVEYWVNGNLHRVDDPAIIYSNGAKTYFLNGEIHREGGPAIIRANGTIEYYLNDKYLDISTDAELKDYLILRIFE